MLQGLPWLLEKGREGATWHVSVAGVAVGHHVVSFQMEERRDSMLETARHCFTSAARCEGDGDEEEWLIHYMLGKVAEKQQQPPTVYLRHYRQAGHYLHEEAARYPKKIHYHNPPELAMEALEVTPHWPRAGTWGGDGPVSLSPWGWGTRSQ